MEFSPLPFLFPLAVCGPHFRKAKGDPELTCVSSPPAHAPYQQPGASPEHTIGWSNNQLAPRRKLTTKLTKAFETN